MKDLKMLIKMCDVPMWKIADAIGIAESTLYIWMRKYNAEHHDKIMKALQEINPEGFEEALHFVFGKVK